VCGDDLRHAKHRRHAGSLDHCLGYRIADFCDIGDSINVLPAIGWIIKSEWAADAIGVKQRPNG
jgi:hypothetical protein